jgi:hypothetical protein
MTNRSSSLLFLLPVALLGFVTTAAANDDRPPPLQAVSPLDCRRLPQRQAVLTRFGGTKETEAAVERALQWIVEHQLADGGWSFDHCQAARCEGGCDRAGTIAARNAATALALLALLGAGRTHLEGPAAPAVRRGLSYLTMRIRADGGLLEGGGTMYSHGLGSLALGEAYALTGDENLKKPAEASIKFLAAAQDPVGGGWRYLPRQPGDTSVTGWQLSAVKAAQLGLLPVPEQTWPRARQFLAGVSEDQGFAYGYTSPGHGPSTTAIGLWSQQNFAAGALPAGHDRGVAALLAAELKPGMFYHNFFASQVARDHGGAAWPAWNKQLQTMLLAGQTRDGHAAGSWFSDEREFWATRAGRLYCTCLSVLTLEVYYRYGPISAKTGP